MRRYRVLRDSLVARFPFIVVADDGEPAYWQPDAKLGKVSMRFRTEA